MFYRYLKVIALSTLLLQAAPIAFDSLGNELEEFKEDCQTFQKITDISVEIDKACSKYQLQLDKAFDEGYKLDPSIEADNVNERKAHKYLFILRHLDKRKEKILGLLQGEVRKARKESNVNYYGELIENYKVKLYNTDYVFMGKHKKILSQNSRYIFNRKHIQHLEEERLKKEKEAQYKKRQKKKLLQSGFSISSMDQISPKAFHSLGNELEEFKGDCQTFQKITDISDEIDKACKKYQRQLDKAFKVGYKLDPSVEQDNVNEKKAYQYLSMLRDLDKRKLNILGLLYVEARKARDQKNFIYYGKLTENYKVKLYDSDYKFMGKYRMIFRKNARYIAHNKHLQYLEEERIKKEKAKPVSHKKRNKYYRVNY